jgi:hypothetical protein
MESSSLDDVALHTLNLLEWRLRRLEFVLNGTAVHEPAEDAPGDVAVVSRIQKLEKSLRQLANKSAVVSDLLKLRKFSQRSLGTSHG